MLLVPFRLCLALFVTLLLLPVTGCGGGSSRVETRAQKIVFRGDTSSAEKDVPKNAIYLMNPDGSGKKPLFPGITSDNDNFPSFTPDGRRILFTRPIAPCAYDGCDTTPTQIWSANVDGTGAKPLTIFPQNSGMPSFSADGAKILFSQSDENRVISFHTMNADGTGMIEVLRGVNLGEPSLSPDGNTILYDDYNDASGRAVYTVRTDGTGKTLIAANAEEPSYSPDGTEIVFVRTGDDAVTGIYRMNADGTEQTRLTDVRDYQQDHGYAGDFSPYFSPDGQSIVFGSTRYRERIGQDRSYYLFTMNRNGTNQTPVPLRFAYETGREPLFHDFAYKNCWATVPQ